MSGCLLKCVRNNICRQGSRVNCRTCSITAHAKCAELWAYHQRFMSTPTIGSGYSAKNNHQDRRAPKLAMKPEPRASMPKARRKARRKKTAEARAGETPIYGPDGKYQGSVFDYGRTQPDTDPGGHFTGSAGSSIDRALNFGRGR